MTVNIPSGLTQYQTTVAYQNIDQSPLNVQVSIDFNVQSGLLTAAFTSLDPGTGQAPNGLTDGFLPPDDANGIGEGFVQYTVQPKSGLVTPDEINQQASVVFDINAPLDTATFTNTIDSGAPASSVAALPAVEGSASFTVNWSGSDDAGGSGIAGYDVYVSDNGGAFTLFQAAATATSATFNGLDGHTYSFYSVATDHVGNVQPTPSTQTTTTVAATPFKVSEDIYVIGSGTVSVSAANGVLANDTGSGTLVSRQKPSLAPTAARSRSMPTARSPIRRPPTFRVSITPSTRHTIRSATRPKRRSTSSRRRAEWYGNSTSRCSIATPTTADCSTGSTTSSTAARRAISRSGSSRATSCSTKSSPTITSSTCSGRPMPAAWPTGDSVWHATGGPEIIKAGFADSPEFYTSAGGTPETWITELYHRILNREPDPQGKQYWLDYLTSHGNTAEARKHIALGFFTSLEAYKGDVTGWFQEYVGRAPTTSELNQYAGEMLAGKTDRDIEQEITNLPEYGQNPPAAPPGAGVRLPNYLP